MRKALVFFGILDDSDVEWLMLAGKRQDLTTGNILIQEGRPADSMFIVIDGSLRVTVGRTEIARLSPGEIVGELSFVDARPPSASVSALERSLVLAIPRDRLSKNLADDIPFSARFYRAVAVFLSDRLRRSVSQLGYGQSGPSTEQIEERDGLDPDVLENLAIASRRFDQIQRRLRGVGSAV